MGQGTKATVQRGRGKHHVHNREGQRPDVGSRSDAARFRQVGGDHYKKYKIQPVEYIHANKIPFIEGNVIKYVTRWRDKGGLKDIDKAIHLLEFLKQLES